MHLFQNKKEHDIMNKLLFCKKKNEKNKTKQKQTQKQTKK